MNNEKTLLALKIESLPSSEKNTIWSFLEQGQVDELLKYPTKYFKSWSSDFTKQKELLENCNKFGINCLTCFDQGFPFSQNSSFAAPLVLFYLGALPECLGNKNNIAIVGSRNADRFGLDFTKNISCQLGRQFVITSGLALGIDSAAHHGALQAGKCNNTIAVLAHGLDQIYPASNKNLARQIIDQSGALVSQYPPGTKPLPHQFLIRNAVIAGLAKAVLVVQAGLKSGSLATARHALESGKDVMALPGRIDDPRFEGTNRLIQQGAHLVCNSSDIFTLFGITDTFEIKSTRSNAALGYSELSVKIIKLIKTQGAIHYLDLIEQLEHAERAHEELLQLELDGIIRRQVGNYLELCTS